ncbi:sulfotransferase family protein [Halospina denitrificans]|uniref:Sulfotransferase family protein n=1 Tax=Halospina denitrificans TaxID=332522 RepID=A0A4R7JZQ7_9GAMM|nr:sulfotransferase [Halospina denitrificans]TDT43464.1 sulfotransferase family protein [Halospina denitrificans]
MPTDERIRKRRSEFARNDDLESLLRTLNEDLASAEAKAMQPYREQTPPFPPVFVMGAPRCGSTLFMQWLASTGVFAYPSNLLSRFWAAPITGARIQKALTDPAYDFRDELHDLKGNTNFESHHGKTAGALSPNEFWYFWRRFLPGNEYRSREELERIVDSATLRAEIAGMTDLFAKPFACKGMIFNENIPYMAELFPTAIFIWLRRQPEYNIQSLLLARDRQYGNMNQWYSFKIKEYPQLKNLDPLASVAGQVASINRSVEKGIADLPAQNKLVIQYEDFCQRPEYYFNEITQRVFTQSAIGDAVVPELSGETSFSNTNVWKLAEYSQEEAARAYKAFKDDKE